MKTLHLTAIISVVTIFAFVMFLVIQSQHPRESGIYQYEIHEPYALTDKYHETITLQNKTFFVYDITKSLNTSNSTETEWYGIKFSLPHGSQSSTTSGGGIFESYVTFPNETVPYRLAIGQFSSSGAVHYDYTTVLSTHTDPQAGITLHNETVGLLVNWPEVHSDLAIIGLNETYRTGQLIDFQIEAKGFDYFNGAETPVLWIEKPNGCLVWSLMDKNGLTLCCVPELVNYDRMFNLTNLGGPITIDKPGSYNLVVSYNNQKIQKQFSVILPETSTIFDETIAPMSANVINTNFTINYGITGNNKILDANMDTQSKSLILSLETTSNGTLTVSVPRALLDSKENNQDTQFIVLVDGQEVKYTETTSLTARTLTIPFELGVEKIEIIATQRI